MDMTGHSSLVTASPEHSSWSICALDAEGEGEVSRREMLCIDAGWHIEYQQLLTVPELQRQSHTCGRSLQLPRATDDQHELFPQCAP